LAAVVLASVAGELGDDWAAALAADAFVAIGWQGLLRALVAGRAVEPRPPVAGPLLTRADLVVVSDDDLGPAIRPSAAVALTKPGATLVITRGERGGSAFSRPAAGRSALRTYRAIPSRATVDPTGAGDVLLAALVATTIDPARLGVGTGWSERLRFAAAAASLVVEAPGLAGVPDLAAVRARLAGRA
jgi:sugar/nucleoside kinase (ribokinase family)